MLLNCLALLGKRRKAGSLGCKETKAHRQGRDAGGGSKVGGEREVDRIHAERQW